MKKKLKKSNWGNFHYKQLKKKWKNPPLPDFSPDPAYIKTAREDFLATGGKITYLEVKKTPRNSKFEDFFSSEKLSLTTLKKN